MRRYYAGGAEGLRHAEDDRSVVRGPSRPGRRADSPSAVGDTDSCGSTDAGHAEVAAPSDRGDRTGGKLYHVDYVGGTGTVGPSYEVLVSSKDVEGAPKTDHLGRLERRLPVQRQIGRSAKREVWVVSSEDPKVDRVDGEDRWSVAAGRSKTSDGIPEVESREAAIEHSAGRSKAGGSKSAAEEAPLYLDKSRIPLRKQGQPTYATTPLQP